MEPWRVSTGAGRRWPATTKSSLLFATLLVGAACNPSSGDQRSLPAPEASPRAEQHISAAGLRLLPEWDPVSAVVVSVSQAFDSETFSKTSGPGAHALLDERLKFYSSIADFSPDVELIMLVNEPEHEDLARAAMRNRGNLSILAQPSWVWMRDFFPLSAATPSGDRALVGYTRYMSHVSKALADHLEVPLVRGTGLRSRLIEGGNIMVDGQGRCYVSVYASEGKLEAASAAEVSDLSRICTEVRTVPKMSFEMTGHIDIFARFLNDTTVLVADYNNEGFHLAAEPVERQFSCSDQQVRRQAWQECAPLGAEYPAMGRLRMGPIDSSGDVKVTILPAQLISTLNDYYPQTEVEVRARKYHLGRQEHVDAVAEAFAEFGFDVVRLRNPTPYLSLERVRYQDNEGRVIKSTMLVQTVFPTYTNSLMVNGVVYLPQYANATNSDNAQAVSLHEQAGFAVVPTDMTQSISFRGASRCLATEIHGNAPLLAFNN
ncbi:MAG: agmatine deiminase family protein [Gemmatimonadota bacterium]